MTSEFKCAWAAFALADFGSFVSFMFGRYLWQAEPWYLSMMAAFLVLAALTFRWMREAYGRWRDAVSDSRRG